MYPFLIVAIHFRIIVTEPIYFHIVVEHIHLMLSLSIFKLLLNLFSLYCCCQSGNICSFFNFREFREKVKFSDPAKILISPNYRGNYR